MLPFRLIRNKSSPQDSNYRILNHKIFLLLFQELHTVAFLQLNIIVILYFNH